MKKRIHNLYTQFPKNIATMILNKRIKAGIYPPTTKRQSCLVDAYRLKDQVREKYHNLCAICHTNHNLSVRHIKPFKTHPDLDLVFDNLVLLCNKCCPKRSKYLL